MSRTLQIGTGKLGIPATSSDLAMIPSSNATVSRPYPRTRQAQIPPRIDKVRHQIESLFLDAVRFQ